MLFQALDDKKDCIGVFAQGQLHFESIPEELTHTWDYSPSLCTKDVQLAIIYAQGATLSDLCPLSIRDEYERVNHKMLAFYKSFRNSKVSLHEHCFYDLVPQRPLLEFFSLKNKICQHVFETCEKPSNHDFLLKVIRMVKNISLQEFPVDKDALAPYLAESRARAFRNSLPPQSRVRYDAFGTVTGRLTTSKDSFPILTLDKKFRKIVKPKNDWLVEIDFNAAELRTLLGLSGSKQPEQDLHKWNMKNLYKDSELTRDEAKERVFSWLYNPNSLDKEAEKYYCRDKLVKKYYSDGKIRTPMGRTIESKERTALNYLIQSTSSDIFLSSAHRVWEMLEGKKSEVRFLVHDSVLLDLSDDDKGLLPEMIKEFSNTPLGNYKVGVSIGRNYGEMRKMK